MIALLAFLVAMVVIIIAANKKVDVPDSVSEIAYIIPHWAFSSWIVLVGMLLMPDLMEHLPDGLQFIGFLSVVGLFCVAASSYYRTEAAPLHYIGGVLCALCATIVTAIIAPVLLLTWSVFLIHMAVCRFSNWCFWGEAYVFTLLVLALMC